mgnify:CR=1 FL=1
MKKLNKKTEPGTKITLDFCPRLKTLQTAGTEPTLRVAPISTTSKVFSRHASRHSTAFKRATALRVAMFHCEA